MNGSTIRSIGASSMLLTGLVTICASDGDDDRGAFCLEDFLIYDFCQIIFY